MKIILDTDVVINHIRGIRTIPQTHLIGEYAISIITHAELVYGAYKSKNPKRNKTLIREILKHLKIQIVPLDEAIIETYGQLKTTLEEKGEKLDEFDLLIAATALTHSLPLATQNTKHFSRISELKLQSA